MKKGFTLIELLAVIVILAIIALIALPIILNIIGDAKEESNKRSIDLYASAIRNAMAKYQLKEEVAPTNFIEIEKYIEYEGSKVECKTKEIYSNGKIYISDCTVNGKTVEYEYGKEENHLAKENVKAATTSKSGIVPKLVGANIKPGSEFKIKVNEEIGWLTFFVLSNEGKYVNLIAQKNLAPNGTLAGESQTGDEWYSLLQDNRYGPQTAYKYLSGATSNWINVPIIESFNYLDEGNQKNSDYGYQGITTILDEKSGNYITTITPYSSDYGVPTTYKNMRTRLPKYSEIIKNSSCEAYSNSMMLGSCARSSLWLVDYLKTNSNVPGGTSLDTYSTGYWLLSSRWGSKYFAFIIYHTGKISSGNPLHDYGIRPVITVLKSDLLRVMPETSKVQNQS